MRAPSRVPVSPWLILLSAVSLGWAGCNPVPAEIAGQGERDRDGGTSAAPATPSGQDPIVPLDPEGLSEDGGNCGVQKFVLERQAPDLLIVLDASGSMDEGLGGGGSKWSQVTSTLKQTVASTQADIGWGLEFFPLRTDLTCQVGGEVAVPVAPQNAANVAKALDAQATGGGTPTGPAIRTGMQHLLSLGRSNPKFMMLATDGLPTCAPLPSSCSCAPGQISRPSTNGGAGQCCTDNNGAVSCTSCPPDHTGETLKAIKEAAEKGIHTFVIGVGLDSTATANLDEMAIAGKEPRAGTPRFYAVSNQGELVSAVNSISRGIISCTFTLAMAPPKPDYVAILVNGKKVPRDRMHVDGWDYGATSTTIQFFGTYCQDLQASSASTVSAVFGCALN